MRVRTTLPLVVLLAGCSSGDSTSPGGTSPVLTSVQIVAPAGSITVGATLQLTAKPKDQNGNAISATVIWSSSSNAVATVTATGLVTGLGAGAATISAKAGSVSATPLVVNVIAAGGTYPLTADVFMPGNIYSPFITDIARTGTVNFYFPVDPDGHNVLFSKTVAGAPPDIDILKNTMQSRQFNTVGTFSYDCTVHPGMSGLIVVH